VCGWGGNMGSLLLVLLLLLYFIPRISAKLFGLVGWLILEIELVLE
jgi:hypothetical protein